MGGKVFLSVLVIKVGIFKRKIKKSRQWIYTLIYKQLYKM